MMSAAHQDIRQSYKTRAEAYALFVKPGGYPISRAQFYDDCTAYHLLDAGAKSVQLSALLAYVKQRFELDQVGGGRGLEDEQHSKEKRTLEMRKLRAEVEAQERKNRRDDANWMEVVEHETQMAAFAGRIEEALQQEITLRLTELIYLCAGEVKRAAEFHQSLDQLVGAALTDAVREQTQSIAFEEDQDAAAG